MSLRRLLGVGAILLAAAATRVPLLTQNRFHPDEALYASFGRLIASGRDPWLSSVVVDKPPLGFYLLAGSFALFGPSEFAARLPTFAASLIGVAFVYRLSRRLFRSTGSAAAACLLLGLSPFAILFSATLFQDTLLAAFLLWAMLAALRNRAWVAGLAFGFAFLAKQSALLFYPLVAVLALLRATSQAAWQGLGLRPKLSALVGQQSRLALTTALAVLIAFGWDIARRPEITFWKQGYSDNSPDRFVRSGEVWPRLRALADLLHYLAVSHAAEILLILGLGLLVWQSLKQPELLSHAAGLAIFVFCLSYLAAYWLLAFNVWDRYLVALLPLICVLAGRGVFTLTRSILAAAERRAGALGPAAGPHQGSESGGRRLSPLWRGRPKAWVAALLLAAFMAAPAVRASRSGYPIGGDHGPYDGIDEMAKYIQTLPPGSVLYDQWLSWQWRFYLFDSPAHIVWQPSPGALGDDLAAFGQLPTERYLVVPSWESAAEVQSAIEPLGFSIRPVHATLDRNGKTSMTLYRFFPSSQ